MFRVPFSLLSKVATTTTRLTPVSAAASRCISATPRAAMPLEEFRDPIPRQQRMSERVGRSWKARELRRKSFDDLHKLWLVLYKEKNMLLTEQQLSRRKQIVFPQPERLKKVGKSMGAIRQVLGERKRERMKNLINQAQPRDVSKDIDMVETVKEVEV